MCTKRSAEGEFSTTPHLNTGFRIGMKIQNIAVVQTNCFKLELKRLQYPKYIPKISIYGALNIYLSINGAKKMLKGYSVTLSKMKISLF